MLLAAAVAMAVAAVPAQASDRPAAVTGVTAAAGDSPGELVVAWDARTDGANDYRVALAPADSSYSHYGDLTWNAYPTDTTVTFTGLVHGAEYKVKVRARFRPAAPSDWSQEAVGTAAAEAEAPPPLSETETEVRSQQRLRKGRTISLDTGDGHWSPWGVWSDGATLWVTDRPVGDARLYAYDLATGARQSERDILALDDAGNDYASGIWSDGTTIWVSDFADSKIYAYDLASGDRSAHEDIEIEDASYPTGIWSDGTTMWVIDGRDHEIHAYDLASGERRAEKDIDSLRAAGNFFASGLWSDGVTAWVSDVADDRVYAYDLATGVRRPDLEFDELWTQAAGGSFEPRGIWSNGATMWVVDDYQFKVFSYRMPAIAALSSLDLDGVDFDFSMARSEYTPRVTRTTTSTTVTVTAAKAQSHVEITPADADDVTDGHQVNLSPGANTITVTVTNGSRSRVYTAEVTRTDFDAISDDATLNSVTLDGIDFDTFDPATTRYVLSVPSSVTSTAVTAISADENADVAITPLDSDTSVDGHQMTLDEGANSISITAESSDGTRELTYDITVNRASDAVFGWNAVKDINPTDTPDDLSPQGIWSNGSTIWIVDSNLWDYLDDQHPKVLAFDLADGSRRSGEDITGFSRRSEPRGIWSDDTTMWISDYLDLEILAYDLASGVRQADKDISDSGDASVLHGLWSDGETIWAVDQRYDKIYAFNLETGTRETDLDVDIAAAHGRPSLHPGVYSEGDSEDYGNLYPTGLWSNGITMWVADDLDERIYAYSRDDGSRQADLEFDLALGNDEPRGLWSDGETMWVADVDAGKVFAYNLPDPSTLTSAATEPFEVTLSCDASTARTLTSGHEQTMVTVTLEQPTVSLLETMSEWKTKRVHSMSGVENVHQHIGGAVQTVAVQTTPGGGWLRIPAGVIATSNGSTNAESNRLFVPSCTDELPKLTLSTPNTTITAGDDAALTFDLILSRPHWKPVELWLTAYPAGLTTQDTFTRLDDQVTIEPGETSAAFTVPLDAVLKNGEHPNRVTLWINAVRGMALVNVDTAAKGRVVEP